MATPEFVEWSVSEGEVNGVKHGSSTVEVHEVTDETAGEYQTLSGSTRADKGSVLIRTYRPDIYDVLPAQALRDNGYSPAGETPAVTTDEEPVTPPSKS